jgi:hypothetical protein
MVLNLDQYDYYDDDIAPEASGGDTSVLTTSVPSGTVDVVAERMEVPFAEYDVHRLYTYFKNHYRLTFGRDYDAIHAKDLNVLQGFITRYGPEMACLIVQRLFLRHGGCWQGRPVSIGTFARGSRWITDKVEQDIKRERRAITIGDRRFISLSEFSVG